MIEVMLAAAAKTVLLCTLAFAATRALRRANASLRHFVWTLALVAALALPLGSRWLPALAVQVLPAVVAQDNRPRSVHEGARPEAAPLDAAPRATARAPATTPWVETRTSTLEPRRADAPLWRRLLVAGWLVGAALILAALALALRALRRLERGAGFVDDPEWLAVARSVARELGLRRRVRLMWSTAGGPPMTWGAWRPIVLLPAEATAWPADLRRDVLRHELAHVRRWDFVTQLLARVACAVYWFLPPVWLAARALRLERERACDDQVLRAGGRASTYAAHLLALSRGLQPRFAPALAAVGMARPSQLAERLVAVLDPRASRTATRRGHALFAATAAALVWLPLAAAAPARRAAPPEAQPPVVAPAAAPSPAPASAPITLRRARATEPAGPGEPPAFPPQPPDTLLNCRGDVDHVSSSSRHNNDLTLLIRVGRCRLSLDADTTFTFNDDFTDIVRIPPGGSVRVESDDGDVTRRLTWRSSGSGQIERRYIVNGAEQPLEAAREWLAAALTQLLRRTGYAADERARAIARRGGLPALMAEVDSLRGSYAIRRYVAAGLMVPSTDVVAKQRLIERGTRGITSDYEMAELLITAADIRPRSRELWSTITTAAGRIRSSYERRRALTSALHGERLDGSLAADVLGAAQGIDSDYELAELLLEVQRAYTIDEHLRPGFAKAVSSIQSDYERRRVLDVAVRASSQAAVVTLALELARTMSSDYERTELLVAASPHAGGTPRVAFFEAVDGIRSDYERRRALSAVLRDSLDAAVVSDVLKAAQVMSSDYERAELLVQVARGQRVEGAVRDLYLATADGIRSQYDQDRSLAALTRRDRRAR